MENTVALSNTFSLAGNSLMIVLSVVACCAAISGTVNLFADRPLYERASSLLLWSACLLFGVGFLWICWFHYQIYAHISLELPAGMADWLNRQLETSNRNATYRLPLYDPQHPPRYMVPFWIENEKYYFWFSFYAIMALYAQYRLPQHRFRAGLHLLLAAQIGVMTVLASPFQEPLPQFFAEVWPWFDTELTPMARLGLFMRLYPKMIFYYNAEYMWFHPPLLFMAYGCITITFLSSVFMLVQRNLTVETLGYDAAKFGYLMLTLGMLLGYPWALQAWGPNWWWDPKICSSIMMWAVFSTYLHTRLYANKPFMWYFSSVLGILCFLAMLFTVSASFLFPGEHSFQ